MKFKAAGIGIGWLLLLLCTPVAVAEYDSDEQTRPAFSQQELDQMLAPIALYPDALLSQILMAATYPLEVVQAARWSRAHPELTGDQAVKAVDQKDWDPSVISLTAFPQILIMMDEKLDWTERLGDAFLSQESQVMDTIQDLRQRAMAAGNLQSNDQIRVEQHGQTIVIVQAVPQIVYVPYYNPIIVYGPWWWDAYPPIYWDPWPGYYYRPGFSVSFFWGIGIPVSAGFFYGDCDWHHRRVNIVNVNNYYYNNYYTSRYSGSQARSGLTSPATSFKRGSSVPVAWLHDPEHRRGVPYRVPSLQQKFERSGAVPKGDLGRFNPSSRESLKQPALRPETGTATRKIPEIRSNIQPKVIPGQDFRPDTTDKFKRRDVPETSRTETIISPRSLPEIRSNVQPKGSGSDLRSNVIERPSRHVPNNDRAVQSIPRPSVAPSRIGPESRPQGFEGAGQGGMRGPSDRGYNIQQQTIPNSRSMPAGGIQERAAPAQQRFGNTPDSRGSGNNSFDRTNPHSWKP